MTFFFSTAEVVQHQMVDMEGCGYNLF